MRLLRNGEVNAMRQCYRKSLIQCQFGLTQLGVNQRRSRYKHRDSR